MPEGTPESSTLILQPEHAPRGSLLAAASRPSAWARRQRPLRLSPHPARLLGSLPPADGGPLLAPAGRALTWSDIRGVSGRSSSVVGIPGCMWETSGVMPGTTETKTQNPVLAKAPELGGKAGQEARTQRELSLRRPEGIEQTPGSWAPPSLPLSAGRRDRTACGGCPRPPPGSAMPVALHPAISEV